MTAGSTGEDRCTAAIASLGTSAGRLGRLLAWRTPEEAWAALRAGHHPADPEGSFRTKATAERLARIGAACEACGVRVLRRGSPGYPPALVGDGSGPAVLFALGDPAPAETRPRVALVGTRSASAYGLGVATQWGRQLAEAGVTVVAGLARGVDAAAHEGALAGGTAPVLGILGTAPDAAASRADRLLRGAVADRGAVLSELPPGAGGAAWRFAARNRITAALAHVVVVVEAHRGSGCLGVARAAEERDITVGVVPGSIRNPASAGANQLLADGYGAVVLGVEDVLTAVDLAIARDAAAVAPTRVPEPQTARKRQPAPSAVAARVRLALDGDPVPLDVLIRRTGLPMGQVALGLEHLAGAGMAVGEQGWWSLPQGSG